MSHLPTPFRPESTLNWIAFIILLLVSVACSKEDPVTLELRANADRTTAGGFPITLSATHSPMRSEVIWRINPRSPGKLDNSSGDTVRYLPPDPGAIREEREIEVTAIAGDKTTNLKLILLPADWSALTTNSSGMGELALLDR